MQSRSIEYVVAAFALVLNLSAAPATACPLETVFACGKGDYATATRLWRALAEQGNALAQYSLGLAYVSGEGVPKNDAEAAKWLRNSADQGNANAQYSLAGLYERGEGVVQDRVEALKWYRRAAEQGNANHQLIIGLILYKSGERSPQDYVEAAKWLRKSADQGNADAEAVLGIMFSYSQGVAQDYAESLKWFRKSADQGNADAQVGLAIMYSNGHGVPKNHTEALKWLRKSADQGNADGEYYLGLAYAKGQGLAQDHAEAARWFRKAADQGNLDSQSILGFNYANGRGVPQNFVEALKWSILAASQTPASQNDPNAGALRDAAVRNRDFLVLKMTPTEVAEAQGLAREWKPVATPGAEPSRQTSDTKWIPRSEQCFDGVCLGDSIRKLKAIPWLELADIPQFPDTNRSFPVFDEIRDPGTEFSRLMFGSTLPLNGTVTKEAVREISGLNNPSAFQNLVRVHGFRMVDLGRSALLILADSTVAFCKPADFVAYFRSKSGHATTVKFSPVALSPQEHDLVVQYIGRRFVMQSEAGADFKAVLQRDYPSLVDNMDLQLHCGEFGCPFPELGKSANPTRATAAEAARMAGRDYIVYFTPPSLGYADLELQLISSRFHEFYEKYQNQSLPAVRDRFPNIALSEHLACAKPKPAVPSVE